MRETNVTKMCQWRHLWHTTRLSLATPPATKKHAVNSKRIEIVASRRTLPANCGSDAFASQCRRLGEAETES
jgi:hypothetical protein